MQDNIQARKCKIPTETLMKNTVSTRIDENQYQDKLYNSDDQYSDFEDAESVEAYDENELDQEEEEVNDARNLNDLKKGEELSKSKIINSRQLEHETIFLSDSPGDNLNPNNQFQVSENQNAETANVAFGSSKYKTLLAFISGAMVGHSANNDDQLVSLSEEGLQFASGIHENPSIDANAWIELGFSSNVNRGSIPSMHCYRKNSCGYSCESLTITLTRGAYS